MYKQANLGNVDFAKATSASKWSNELTLLQKEKERSRVLVSIAVEKFV